MVDKRSLYNTALAGKGINHVGQLFDTNGAMKPCSVFKSEFSLSKNSHFYWIQLNSAIPKAWKENLYWPKKSSTVSGNRSSESFFITHPSARKTKNTKRQKAEETKETEFINIF